MSPFMFVVMCPPFECIRSGSLFLYRMFVKNLLLQKMSQLDCESKSTQILLIPLYLSADCTIEVLVGNQNLVCSCRGATGSIVMILKHVKWTLVCILSWLPTCIACYVNMYISISSFC